jgi:hypothetical protein
MIMAYTPNPPPIPPPKALLEWRDEVLKRGDRPKAVRIQRVIDRYNIDIIRFMTC